MPLRLTIIGCLILLAAGGPQSLAQPAPPAAAQPPGRLTVAEAVADSNGDFVPDRSGQLVTLTGVIVYEPRVLGQSATVAALQDESAAIWIFADRASEILGKIARGDLVEVTGAISSTTGGTRSRSRPAA